MRKSVLAIFAHPDDTEFMCAGALSLLNKKGWSVHIDTLTPGDKGTSVHSRKEINNIGKAEAVNTAKFLDGIYPCLSYNQRNWLKAHPKLDEYILSMKQFAETRGKEISTRYAEGFRQHLGHGYTHDNILKEIPGDLIVIK
jgi:LmbE family N-acetylglucosaminyl deacetylase